MQTTDAMRAVVARAGLSSRAASVACGRSPSWLSVALARPRTCEAATVALLGRACGHTLALVPTEELPPSAIVIDPLAEP